MFYQLKCAACEFRFMRYQPETQTLDDTCARCFGVCKLVDQFSLLSQAEEATQQADAEERFSHDYEARKSKGMSLSARMLRLISSED